MLLRIGFTLNRLYSNTILIIIHLKFLQLKVLVSISFQFQQPADQKSITILSEKMKKIGWKYNPKASHNIRGLIIGNKTSIVKKLIKRKRQTILHFHSLDWKNFKYIFHQGQYTWRVKKISSFIEEIIDTYYQHLFSSKNMSYSNPNSRKSLVFFKHQTPLTFYLHRP